ncbi:MAG: type II toxin-antitoxin system Phd/YefM family antitoxin, partial [Chloroflexi bacterium]|nr:type II toxin-antitoxin system Phd/YefM family antitoxin [Chloroflexota bacterium]
MPEIGIRDLKMKASKVVQTVYKRKTRYTITRRGRPVAMLIPIDEATSRPTPRQSGATMSADEVWNELTE